MRVGRGTANGFCRCRGISFARCGWTTGARWWRSAWIISIRRMGRMIRDSGILTIISLLASTATALKGIVLCVKFNLRRATLGGMRISPKLLSETDVYKRQGDVWRCDPANFAYKREWQFTPTWESPCGLLIRSHGNFWGEVWVGGEFHCAENDNPLFECPRPGAPCDHRLPYPAGINCQFHRTDRVWAESGSCERLIRERLIRERQWREVQMRDHPGFDGFCANLRKNELPDGMFRYEKNYWIERCISLKCKNTQCPCLGWKERDVRPANIFYDLYIERKFTEGLVPYSEKSIIKGLKVFEMCIRDRAGRHAGAQRKEQE